MTNLEKKYEEFREAFREAVLNGDIECKISKQSNPNYNADIYFKFGNVHLKICVADRYICYYDQIIDEVFKKDDIVVLNKMIRDYFAKDKEKYDRIAELKKELEELEKEVA